MPSAADELCWVSDRTPERPDGHECREKCDGRLHGICDEADPDCEPLKTVRQACMREHFEMEFFEGGRHSGVLL